GRAEVVDSGSASMGEGFVAVEAARAAREGAGLEDAAATARRVATRVSLLGAIESFDHLRRSGRVSKLQAYAATALSIRPVFPLVAGEIEPVGRARTRSKALVMLVDELVRSTAAVAGGG